MPNLKEHDLEGIGNALFSLNVYVSFVLAFDVCRGNRVVGDGARDAICVPRYTSTYKIVNAKRDGSDCNCSVTVEGLSNEASTKKSGHSHVFVSGLKNLNPRSESRRSSWLASHGLEANPPTRKTSYTWIVRCAGKETLNVRTGFKEIISVKFSLIASTVDWIDGSKNPATCSLHAGGDVGGHVYARV